MAYSSTSMRTWSRDYVSLDFQQELKETLDVLEYFLFSLIMIET